MEELELKQKVSRSALALRAFPAQRVNASNPNVDRIVRDSIMGLDVTTEGTDTRAEAYHQHFFEHAETRWEAISKSFMELGQPQDMIIMLSCKQHFQFLQRWLDRCDQANIVVRDKSLLFALDHESYEKAQQLGLQSYHFDTHRYQTGGQSSVFGDTAFSGAVYYKNAIIHDCLKLGVNLLFQDVDLFWFKDPFNYLHEHNANCDIQIMYDGRNPWHYPFYANTGFIFIRNTLASRAFFETALFNSSSLFAAKGHQAPFNRILSHFVAHNVLSLAVLPEQLFLNGHLYNLVRGIAEEAGNWQDDGIVLHYSWAANVEEKLRKLEMFGLI